MELMKLCRACLLPEDIVHLLDWYQPIDSLEHVLSYKECFCKCTQINLRLIEDPNDKDDSRTEYLCSNCAQSLKDAHDFIEKAKKADIELRAMRINKNFEWVSVIVKEREIDKKEEPVVVDDKTLLDINLASVWHENTRDERDDDDDKVLNKADDEITGVNLNEEKLEYEPISEPKRRASRRCRYTKSKKNEQILTKNAKTDSDDKDFINVHTRRLNLSNDGGSSVVERKRKKFKEQRNKKDNKPNRTTVNMDELVSCDVCNKTMSRRAYSKHKLRHGPKSFLCQWCPSTFGNADTLKNHEETHKEHRERHKCEKCNNTYLSEYNYRRHLRIHDDETGRKPMFQCTQCDKSFLHKSGLKTHELHHKGAKEECNICHKRYVRRIDLADHVRTHSAECPFVCSECGKSFTHKGILNRHKQYHGFLRYTCLICKAEFSKYYKYYLHRMQHSGYPYKCGICEKQFPDAYRSKRHIRRVHKVEKDEEVDKLMVKINSTKEYRGVIVEVLNNIEDKGKT